MGPSQAAVQPSIRIDVSDGLAIRQRRPALATALIGMAVEDALDCVPRLLPICGQAQSVAAQRAVTAVLGTEDAEMALQSREQQLWFEQARAAAWRLAVDWPDFLGEPRQLEPLARIRRLDSLAECRDCLMGLMPGIEAVQDHDSAVDWANRRGSLAARLVAHALATIAIPEPDVRCVTGAALLETALAAFGREPFDPLAPHCDGPFEVGGWTTASAVLDNGASPALGAQTRRLLCQLIDTRALARQGPALESWQPDAWKLAPDCGLGRASTLRGPVFHRVILDQESRVRDWRVLAPTDWHFAPNGPVALAGGAVDPDHPGLGLLVLSYDPCAPWEITGSNTGAEPEAV